LPCREGWPRSRTLQPNLLHREKAMAVNQKLLDILVCPKCKGDLVLTENSDGLICYACRLKYEIKDDIPIMLIDEALPVEFGEAERNA